MQSCAFELIWHVSFNEEPLINERKITKIHFDSSVCGLGEQAHDIAAKATGPRANIHLHRRNTDQQLSAEIIDWNYNRCVQRLLHNWINHNAAVWFLLLWIPSNLLISVCAGGYFSWWHSSVCGTYVEAHYRIQRSKSTANQVFWIFIARPIVGTLFLWLSRWWSLHKITAECSVSACKCVIKWYAYRIPLDSIEIECRHRPICNWDTVACGSIAWCTYCCGLGQFIQFNSQWIRVWYVLHSCITCQFFGAVFFSRCVANFCFFFVFFFFQWKNISDFHLVQWLVRTWIDTCQYTKLVTNWHRRWRTTDALTFFYPMKFWIYSYESQDVNIIQITHTFGKLSIPLTVANTT